MERILPESLLLGRHRIQNLAAADGFHRGIKPDDEPVSLPDCDLFFQPQLCITFFAVVQHLPIQKDHLAKRLCRSVIQVDPALISQRPFGIVKHPKLHIQHAGPLQGALGSEDVPSLQFLFLEIHQIHSSPLACIGGVHHAAVDLEAAHFRDPVPRIDLHLVSHGDLSLCQGAGDDGTKSADGEDPVDGNPEQGWICPAVFHIFCHLQDQLFQFFHVLTGIRGDWQQGSVFQKGSPDDFSHVFRNQLQPFGLHQVCLGEDDDAASDAQHLQDLKMFHGLRHDPFIRSHNQQDQVDAADPGQHVPDKLFVTGHVDDPDLQPFFIGHFCKTQLYGDAPLFFFFEPVSIDTGEDFDQAGFTMVHMASCSNDHVTHCAASYDRRFAPKLPPPRSSHVPPGSSR